MQPDGVNHEKQLRMVARLCGVGGWMLELSKPLRFHPSPEWLRLHGCEADARPSALQVLKRFGAPGRIELGDCLRRCAREGEPFELVLAAHTFDDRQVFMRMIAEPDYDAAGQVCYIHGACQDVTQLMERERELDEHRSRLEGMVEQRTRDLRVFAYSLAHDLRAPIAAMGGFSQVATEMLPQDAPPRIGHYLQRIVANALRAEALVEGILSLISVTQAPLDKRDVDVTAAAWMAVEQLRTQEPGRKVEVEVQPGMRAQADARLLGSVVENLLGNAWKFSAQAQPARIAMGKDASGAFYVRDNGIGFDASDASRLFEPLQRLPGALEYAGTGVGLAAASRIVGRHGGRMWADGRPQEGATFWFTLPSDGV